MEAIVLSQVFWEGCGRTLIAVVNQYMITNLMLLFDYKSEILNYDLQVGWPTRAAP